MKNTYEDDEKQRQEEKARFLKALDLYDARTKCENLLEPMRQEVAKLEAEHASLAEARGELEEDLAYARKEVERLRHMVILCRRELADNQGDYYEWASEDCPRTLSTIHGILIGEDE